MIVSKTVTEDVKEYVDEVGSTQMTQGTDYTTVEVKYTDAASTPLVIEIKDKTTATFDVGKAVKVKINVKM